MQNHPTFNDELFQCPSHCDQLSIYGGEGTDHLPSCMLSGQCSFFHSSGQSKHNLRRTDALLPVSSSSLLPSSPGTVHLERIPLSSSKGMMMLKGNMLPEFKLVNRSRTRLRAVGNSKIVRQLYCGVIRHGEFLHVFISKQS